MFGHDEEDQNNNGGVPVAHHDPAVQDDVQAVVPQHDQQNDGSDSGIGGFEATPETPVNTPPPAVTDDLLDIKQEALQALTPLVGQLDQTPEEQFRTTMMMIQASDNHALVRVAYNAAKQISNEKERAQALLDIVNEINYFTQHTQA